MPDVEIKSFTVSGSSTAPQLAYTGDKIMVKLKGDYLKQDKVTYSHEPIINIYIVYNLYGFVTNSSATLENCLFGAVTLTKNMLLINTNILDMVLDLIQKELFHIQVEALIEMLLFLELI